MRLEIPIFERRHILRGLGYGVILLFWLSTENTSLWVVSLLGAGLAGLLLIMTLLRWFGGKNFPLLPSLILLGVGIGFGAVWCTVGLMIFKNAWHAHAYPDFPNSIILGITHRLLPWSMAGGLLGGAFACWRWGSKN